MYTTLFTYYTTYNNNEAKHNNTADEQEIDFLVYLTGGFMRFLIQLKRNEKKILGKHSRQEWHLPDLVKPVRRNT